MTERCPKGHSVPEECFAPFRYCPEKGCGRAEGGVRLPTAQGPVIEEPTRSEKVHNLLTAMQKRAEAAPAQQPLDPEHWSTPHRHYNRDAMLCEHGEPLNVGWLEMAQEQENAQQILDMAGVPDGLGQGPGDLDWRVAEMFIDRLAEQESLSRISDTHARETGQGGMVGDYCAECSWRWPCRTYLLATGKEPNEQVTE